MCSVMKIVYGSIKVKTSFKTGQTCKLHLKLYDTLDVI